MYTIRGGPRTLLLETNNPQFSLNAFLNHPSYRAHINYGPHMKVEYNAFIGLAEERMTIIQLTRQMKPLLSFDQQDFYAVILLDLETDLLMMELIDCKEKFYITTGRMGPKLVVLKSMGNSALFFEAVQKDIRAIEVSVSEMYEGVSEGTLVLITEKNLSRPIPLDHFLTSALYSPKAYSELKKYLTANQLKYTNASIQNKDWYELKIKIYDSYGHYTKHYQRLIHIIDALDLGFVLGESWGTDAAMAFMSVGVYNVRLLSFIPPESIKKILLGLEYTQEGKRIVDYDLFYKKRKITWTDLRIKGLKTRELLSDHYREALTTQLTEADLKKLLQNDLDIENQRNKGAK